MLISGSGITNFNAKIKPDFLPETTLSLTWFQRANNAWAATDRGAGADTYDVDVKLYGKEDEINNFINEVEANREAGSNVINLSNINSQEKIFGADVDYSEGVDATVFMEKRDQKTWKGYGLTVRLSCLSPTFTGGVGSLPILRFLDIGIEADSDYTINKFDSYSRVFSYQEHGADSGIFTGVYTFTDEEMIAARRFVATTRAAAFPMPTILGVIHPFGRRPNPEMVKMTEFIDQGMVGMTNGLSRWKAKITLVEDF